MAGSFEPAPVRNLHPKRARAHNCLIRGYWSGEFFWWRDSKRIARVRAII